MPFWKPEQNGKNTGDDIAGTVVSVGEGVSEFAPGDRVAAFHEMTTPSGSYAEYAIAPETTTFHIPSSTSFEEAATIPLAAMTAAVGLFAFLGLPEPWNTNRTLRADASGGLLIYGGSSAVGAYAIKLARHANIHPLICIAGSSAPLVESLIDRSAGDTVIDYRQPGDKIVEAISAAIPAGAKLRYAFDAVSDHDSWHHICRVLDHDGGRLTTVLPGKEFPGIPSGIEHTRTQVGTVHNGANRDCGYAWFRLFGKGLKEGWFTPHPYEVCNGGLVGVGEGLNRLMQGKVSGKKMVFRVEETEGAGQDKI